MTADQRVFADRESFRRWLVQHHARSPGIRLVLGKTARVQTLSANDALEEALCFGWIDGQLQSIDAHRYLKRFARRRDQSVWSERNRKIAAKLVEQGSMAAAGHAAIARAKVNGTWNRPRPAPISEAQVTVLAEALAGTGKALANFLNMPPSVRRTYAAVYLDAKKDDTRKRRLATIIARLKQNKKPM
jgi:uncharacterized protein YdeI (YjbR/CyaY-like superfamily)